MGAAWGKLGFVFAWEDSKCTEKRVVSLILSRSTPLWCQARGSASLEVKAEPSSAATAGQGSLLPKFPAITPPQVWLD